MKSNKIIMLWTIIVGIFLAQSVYGHRILGLFPHPGISHFHFFQPLMRGLAEAGHEVTVVSHFPTKNPSKGYKDLPLTGIDALQNSIDLKLFANRSPINHFLEYFLLHKWGMDSCENALNSSAISEILKEKQTYDLIIMENFNNDCLMGIAWKLNVPFIGLSSCTIMPWHYDNMGLPHFPSYINGLFVGYTDPMTFAERISNWIGIHGMKLLHRFFTERESNVILKQYLGNDVPELSELKKKVSLLFVNEHFSLSGAKPLSPNVIELGGIHIEDPEPLDPELQHILDSADQGVIYVSWGSMIRSDTLPLDKRTAILKAFAKLPQRILWKWENETLPNQPSNVFIRKWMPQRAILAHPKVRAFMTHGGLMGSSEAAYSGVPTVTTPMYGDQFYNSAAMVNRGMGIILPYEDITVESVYNALKQALEPSTSENAKKVSYSYRNRPQTPIQLGIWWVEHIVATGGASLTKPASVNLSWFVYYSFDVIFTLLAVIFVTIGSWIWVLKLLCCKNKKLKNVKRKSE